MGYESPQVEPPIQTLMRAMTHRKPQDVSSADFSEQQIQQAYGAGDFANLPGFGQPLPGIDEPYDEDWWIKEKLRREKISVLPPSLEIRRDVEQTLAQAMKLTNEAVVRRELQALNERIREANYRSVWGPPSTQLPVNIDEVVARWYQQRGK